MFKNTFQSGFLSILYSLGYVEFLVSLTELRFRSSNFDVEILRMKLCICYYRSKPLQIWDKEGEWILLGD